MLDQAFAHCPIFPTAASRRSLGRVSVPVWLIILSDQLTIVALVGLYPTNKLIVRRLLPRRLSPLTHRCHAVLAVVSHGYPPPKDRYLRVTHPSATDSRNCPCDLHVLSMPPAFALSQDQTLRFIQHIIPQAPQRTPRAKTHQTNRPQTQSSQIVQPSPRGERPDTKDIPKTNCQRIQTNTSADHSGNPQIPTQSGKRTKPVPQTTIRPNHPGKNPQPSHQTTRIPQRRRHNTQDDQHHRSAANISLPSLCICQ